MRPRGEIRQVLAGALKSCEGSTRMLALRTGVGMTAARQTLDNMVRAGEAAVVRAERVPGVKRPVPVYGPSSVRANPAPADPIAWHLITDWLQWPA